MQLGEHPRPPAQRKQVSSKNIGSSTERSSGVVGPRPLLVPCSPPLGAQTRHCASDDKHKILGFYFHPSNFSSIRQPPGVEAGVHPGYSLGRQRLPLARAKTKDCTRDQHMKLRPSIVAFEDRDGGPYPPSETDDADTPKLSLAATLNIGARFLHAPSPGIRCTASPGERGMVARVRPIFCTRTALQHPATRT